MKEENNWTKKDTWEMIAAWLFAVILYLVLGGILGGLMHLTNHPRKNYYYVCLSTVNGTQDYFILKDNDKCASEMMTLRLEKVD